MAEYAKRDHMALGDYYMRHLMAMTAEGLHAKSAIAGELAWRDEQLAAERARNRALLDAARSARAALSDLLMTRDPVVYSDALRQLDAALGPATDDLLTGESNG